MMTARPRRADGTRADREVVQVGLERRRFEDAYHSLLTMRWRLLFAGILVSYLAVNAAFALAYWSVGDPVERTAGGSFLDCFFFSVQTLATIGYGRLAPRTVPGNVLVTAEALVGLMGFAILAGLVFARFSRPTARVLFSSVAVVAPYDGVPSLMFRVANARATRIMEARLRLTLMRSEVTVEGEFVRRLHDLRLRRSEHTAFAFTWTAIHPIDAQSPLFGTDAAQMRDTESDLVVSLTGIDDGLAQTVHARHAYRPEDIRWNSRFADILQFGPDRSVIDYARFHEVAPLGDAKDAAPSGSAKAVMPGARRP